MFILTGEPKHRKPAGFFPVRGLKSQCCKIPDTVQPAAAWRKNNSVLLKVCCMYNEILFCNS